MRQNLSYQNELPLNENGKLFSCLRFCTYLCFKKMSALTWDIENTEPLYTVHVFFEFWRKYLIIISSSSSELPIKLFWRIHNAQRSESERVQFTKELYMLGLACGQIQPIMHFPGKQSSLKGRFRPHQ